MAAIGSSQGECIFCGARTAGRVERHHLVTGAVLWRSWRCVDTIGCAARASAAQREQLRRRGAA